jgi:LmbE family N-acetylglucosaminyl deacetylase
VATVVFLHAHPDDECIATGGTMSALADAGHRVVLVLGTRGELGEVADDFLDEGETLTERRVRETEAAATILGVARVAFLGYRDSGMAGEPTNDDAGSFWLADIDEATGRLLEILEEEGADLLVTYDEKGGYGHPDHLKVHLLGVAVAAREGSVRVLEATMNREHSAADRRADPAPVTDEEPEADGFGMPAARIHLGVDVHPWLDRKRAAMKAHASQISDESFFLAMPVDRFARLFGTEWYIRHGVAERTGELPVDGIEGLLAIP